jgi:hypothetical protein
MTSSTQRIDQLEQSVASNNARILAVTPNNGIYAAIGSFIKFGCKVTEGDSNLDMSIKLEGQAQGDSIYLNPDLSASPTRIFEYPNIAFVKGGSISTTDLLTTVTAAPASTGEARYDIAYIYAGREGVGFDIEAGIASAAIATDFGTSGIATEEHGISVDPILPVGALAVARIYVPYGATAITDAMIADLRSYSVPDALSGARDAQVAAEAAQGAAETAETNAGQQAAGATSSATAAAVSAGAAATAQGAAETAAASAASNVASATAAAVGDAQTAQGAAETAQAAALASEIAAAGSAASISGAETNSAASATAALGFRNEAEGFRNQAAAAVGSITNGVFLSDVVWDASTGVFPASTDSGESFLVGVGGTVDGVEFSAEDRITALTNTPSTTVYAGSWFHHDYTDRVNSVNGQTGAINLTLPDLSGEIPLGGLPSRLRELCMSVNDWDNALSNGWYMGETTTNAPESSGSWFMGTVIAHNTQWVTQTLHQFSGDTASNTQSWRRQKNNNIWGTWERLRVTEEELQTIFAKLASPTFTGQVTIDSTGAITLPRGAEAERPTTPVNGMIRYNNESGQLESYASGAWGAIGGGGGASIATLMKYGAV